MKILVAEDDEISRKSITTVLRKQGHEVVEAQDGVRAWQKMQEQDSPGLLVLDIMMPGMNGLELCRKLRAYYSWNPPYIILLTAKTERHDVVQGLEAGADDYVSKPFNFEELKTRIRVGERMLKLQSSLLSEISERRKAEETLRKSKDKYRQEKNYLDNLFENSPDTIVIVDKQGKFFSWNKGASELFGYSFDEIQNKHFSDFYADQNEMDKMLTLLREIGSIRDYEISFITREGYLKPCSISISILYDEENNQNGSISIIRDLTEWKKAQKKLEEMGLYDSLTGIYNRNFFEEEMIRLGNNRHFPMGIIVCDINGLKLINDTMGHAKGDELLKSTAKILRRCFRAGDIIARTGGDEFAVLLPKSSEEIIRTCTNRIRKEVEHYNKDYPESGLSISIGYSVECGSTENINTVFKRADDNMYKEKLQQSYSSRSETVQALIKNLEERDYITEGHTSRLHSYAHELGSSLGLSEQRLNDLELLARFHDLGKVGVPDHILFKPGPLTEEEFEEIKKHCEIGYRIALSTSDLAPIADYILKHHEWWNGGGYPLGMAGAEIPLECRILHIVDAYDAMTSERPYQNTRTHQEAVEELQRCAGIQFDPELVERFIGILEETNEEKFK